MITSGSMLRFAAPVLLIIVALLVTACSQSRMVIVSDQYWGASWLDATQAAARLHRFAAERGVAVAVRNLSYAPQDPAAVDSAIAESKAAVVVLSPLFSTMAQAVARAFPAKRIVAFRADPQPGVANLVSLVSQPGPAFQEAGSLAASYAIKETRGRPPGGRVVALFSDDSAGAAKAQSFRTGYSAIAGAPPLEVLPKRAADRSSLRAALLDRSSSGVLLYVLAANGLDSFAIDLLNADSTPIITENWIDGAVHSEKVAYSIDEDVLAALRKVVETMGRPADNQIGIPWNVRAVGKPVVN